MFCLGLCRQMKMIASEGNHRTVSPNEWPDSPSPRQPLHYRCGFRMASQVLMFMAAMETWLGKFFRYPWIQRPVK